MKTNTCLLFFWLLFAYFQSEAQVNPVGFKLDENRLALFSGTSVISDATADGGSAIFRPASAQSNTMWFGPYTKL